MSQNKIKLRVYSFKRVNLRKNELIDLNIFEKIRVDEF